MPLKTHKKVSHKQHPRHYAKVYWPYIPLLLIVGLSLFVGQSFVARSQSDVLSYVSKVEPESLLNATNNARQNSNQQPLTANAKLQAAAEAKARDMVARDYWSHTTPDERSPWTFIDAAGYKYAKAGENLAFGFYTSNEAVNGWMNSPSHKANLLDAAYTDVGFGIAESPNFVGNGPETVLVAMYARHISQPAVALGETFDGTNTQLPFTTSQPTPSEPSVQSVSKIQAVAGNRIPGISFIIGLIIGAGLLYIVLKHSIGIKRALKNGEKFVIKHPALDLSVICVIALCVLLSQTVGVIR